jgi:hypothetical protein
VSRRSASSTPISLSERRERASVAGDAGFERIELAGGAEGVAVGGRLAASEGAHAEVDAADLVFTRA